MRITVYWKLIRFVSKKNNGFNEAVLKQIYFLYFLLFQKINFEVGYVI